MKLAQRRDGISPAALGALLSGDIKNFMAASTEGGIEAQEKAGQLEQAEKETLPLDLGQRHNGTLEEARKPWEALGFRFGRIVEEIFVEAKFPKGWTKEPTDHAMWSNIIDEKRRKRGAIFYKAAFYDRSAFARLDCRFGVRSDYGSPNETVSVTDACGKVDFKVTGLLSPDWSHREEATKRDRKIEEARAMCLTYLQNNFPLYDSAMAYWD